MNIPATMKNLKKYADVHGVVMYSPATGEQYSASLGDYYATPADHKFTDRQGNPMQLVIPAPSHTDIVNADLNSIIDRAMKATGTAERTYLRKLWDGESWESVKRKLKTEGSTWVVWYEDGLRAHANLQKIKPPKKAFYQPKLKPHKTRAPQKGSLAYSLRNGLGTLR